MNKSRNVGGLGEAFLQAWAAEVGIVANKAEVDRGGWDYILELPLGAGEDAERALPLDQSLQPVRGLVQVKSTDKRRGFLTLKLSNLKRLVESLLPAFYLVYEFDEKESPQRAFLVHVGPSEIRRVKKRLRELSPEERGRLHKRKMRLTYDSRHELASMSGEALQEAILAHVGRGPQKYGEEKLKTLKTVGYEGGHLSFNMLFDLPDDYGDDVEEYLMDFAIGLVPEIEAKKIELRDVRFDIPAPDPRHEPGPGKLMLSHGENKELKLVLSAEGLSDVHLSAEVFHSSSFLGEGMTDREKMRFSIPYVDLILESGDCPALTAQFELPREHEDVSLADLYSFAQLVLFLEEASEQQTDPSIGFELPNGQSGRLLELNAAELRGLQEDILAEIAGAIRDAWRVCQAFDVEQKARPTLRQIEQQKQQLDVFRKLLQPSPLWSQVNFWMAEEEVDPSEVESFGSVHLSSVSVGQLHLVFLLGIVGQPDETELPERFRQPEGENEDEEVPARYAESPRHELVSRDIRVLGKRLFKREEAPLPLDRLKEEAAEELQDQGVDQVFVGEETDT